MADATYWATMAQVLPLVALGVVVETRAITTSWTPETPRALRLVQSTLWSLTLIGATFGESQALRGARGESPARWWIETCEFVVSSGLGVLILSPALELIVKGNAESIARAASLHPAARLRVWRNDRKLRRLHRTLMTMQLRREELLEQRSSQLAEFAKTIEHDAPLLASLRRRLDELPGEADAANERGELERLISVHEGFVRKLEVWQREVTQQLIDAAVERRQIEESHRSFEVEHGNRLRDLREVIEVQRREMAASLLSANQSQQEINKMEKMAAPEDSIDRNPD